MRRTIALLAIATLSAAQGSGGREQGEGPNAVLFVRWRRAEESGAVYSAAWRALEPHFGVLSRRRLIDFDESEERARACFSENASAALVVAFGAETARLARQALPGRPVLEVAGTEGAHVLARTDRERLARIVRLFHPTCRRIALFAERVEPLAGFEIRLCARPADARECDLAWVPEGSRADARALRPDLDRMRIPLLSTREDQQVGTAALEVRPDSRSLGNLLAALALRHFREGRPLEAAAVQRTWVTVDLKAARAAGYDVPLITLARADAVRRAP